MTVYCVVSYGVYAQPMWYGLPSGAVAVANGVPRLVAAVGVVHGMPSLPIGLNRTFCVAGTGCVGQVLTPSALLCGTGVSLTGMSGLPVSRSSTNVMPTLFTYATAGRVTVLPLTLNFPVKRTPLFGRSESHRSWCTCWKYHFS